MGLRFLPENIQQLRVEAAVLSDQQRLRQALRPCSQLVDVFALTLTLLGKCLNQLGQQHQHVFEQLVNLWRRRHAVFDNSIEQVLDRPRQLTQHQRTHHAPAALEGVKTAPKLGQRNVIRRVGDPLRQAVVQADQYFVGLFQKDFQQLFVQRIFIHRRRQQAGGHVLRRRIERRQRAGQRISQTLRLQVRPQRWCCGDVIE